MCTLNTHTHTHTDKLKKKRKGQVSGVVLVRLYLYFFFEEGKKNIRHMFSHTTFAKKELTKLTKKSFKTLELIQSLSPI